MKLSTCKAFFLLRTQEEQLAYKKLTQAVALGALRLPLRDALTRPRHKNLDIHELVRVLRVLDINDAKPVFLFKLDNEDTEVTFKNDQILIDNQPQTIVSYTYSKASNTYTIHLIPTSQLT